MTILVALYIPNLSNPGLQTQCLRNGTSSLVSLMISFKRLIDDKNHKSQLKKKRKIPARSRFYQSYW